MYRIERRYMDACMSCNVRCHQSLCDNCGQDIGPLMQRQWISIVMQYRFYGFYVSYASGFGGQMRGDF